MTNPFAQPTTAPPAPATNPYAQPSPAPAPQAPPAAPGNPFGAGIPGAPGPVVTQPGYSPQQTYAPVAQPAAAAAPPAPPALNAAGLASAPAPLPSGGKGAKLADMYGRLVLIFPLGITRRPRNPQFITAEQRQRGDLEQDQLTATVVVLDDGQGGMQPIAYGGAPYDLPPRAHTDSAPLPYARKAMWITQSKLIEQVRPFLPQPGGAPGMVCGRVVKAGPQRNDPWYLQGATPEELGLAEVYLNLVTQGTYEHPLA